MLLTIFKYFWILPLAIVYIVWTVMAVKDLMQFIVDCKKYKEISKPDPCLKPSLLDDGYGALLIWIILHMVLLFSGSFGYFIVESGG